MIQRKGYDIVITPKAQERIKNNQCPSCGKPKTEWTRRTDWRCCSVECTCKFEKDAIIRSWTEVRSGAFIRDNFTCVTCDVRPERRETLSWYSNGTIKDFKKRMLNSPYLKAIFVRFEKEKVIIADDSKLIGDHIIPIALGGEEFNINNVQTLCKKCNASKTKADAKDIARERQKEKLLSKNSSLKLWGRQ